MFTFLTLWLFAIAGAHGLRNYVLFEKWHDLWSVAVSMLITVLLVLKINGAFS